MRRECKMHMCNAVCATIHEGFPHLNLGSYEGFPHPNLDFIWREEAKWVWGSQTLGPPVWWEDAKWVWGSQTLGPPNIYIYKYLYIHLYIKSNHSITCIQDLCGNNLYISISISKFISKSISKYISKAIQYPSLHPSLNPFNIHL